jgi:hypothetical protein
MWERECIPKMKGMTRDWRKLHNEELNDLYVLPNKFGDQTKEDEKDGNVNLSKEKENGVGTAVGRPAGWRQEIK